MTDPTARINTRWGHDRAGAVSAQAGQGQESADIGTDVPHRPECTYTPDWFDPERNIRWGGLPCICDRIERAEKRAGDRAYNWGYVDGSKDAREGAFRDALEAVTAVPYFWPNEKRRTYIRKADALAAIDSLREETK